MSAITAFPSVRASALLSGPGLFSTGQYASTYSQAREALYWAIRELRLPPGGVVWMPAFHCGVEVQAAIDAGATVDFYRIRPDLTVDTEDLFHRLSLRSGPVLVIHYFGFPEPAIERIAAECRRYGAALIEDCAHALFSRSGGRELGSYGSISVFSFRKTLPVYDGGAMKGVEGGPPTPRRAPWKAPYSFAAKDLLRGTLGRGVTRFYRRIRFGADAEDYPEKRVNTVIPEDRSYDRDISVLSRRLLASVDPEEVVRRRRENFGILSKLLAGRDLVYTEAPDGVCPLFAVVRVENRPQLLALLAKHGVETFVFGEFAHPTLENEMSEAHRSLRDTLFGLPIHQQLNAKDMREIAGALQIA
jgi:perosamine synthetase